MTEPVPLGLYFALGRCIVNLCLWYAVGRCTEGLISALENARNPGLGHVKTAAAELRMQFINLELLQDRGPLLAAGQLLLLDLPPL